MRLWRWLLILALYAVPVAAFFTVGVVAVWRSGRYDWLWWLAPLCWVAAFVLTRCWRKQLGPPARGDFTAPDHWTTRDREAWRAVELQQRQIENIPAPQLTDPHFYLQSAMDLALAIARHYHPKAKDPVGSLTVLDLLAAAQLAIEDSAQWCQQYVPGSHLMTVDQWRMLGHAPAWFKTASNISWAASILVHPLNLGRYMIARLTTDAATQQLRDQALGWFYMIFVRHVGFYLVEMNSGRLRGGAARYRRLQAELQRGPAVANLDDGTSPTVQLATPETPLEVHVALVGQVKAGKSSLANALVGRQHAAVDVLPLTKHVQRLELRVSAPPPIGAAPADPGPPPSSPEPLHEAAAEDRLVLLDTAGYADDGATPAQLREMHEALRHADLVMLVMDAASPARRADLQMLGELTTWLQANLHRKPPPVLGVLTHIDQLRPALEWTPPYDWRQPSTPKEHSIAGAVAYTREQFGSALADVVAVCTDGTRQRAWGAYEELLPAMFSALGEARGCALLRTLHAELDAGRVRMLFDQLGQACTGLLRGSLKRLQESAGDGSHR